MPPRSAAESFRFAGKKMVGVLTTPGRSRKAPGILMLHGFPGSEQNVDVARALMDMGIASFRLHFSGAWGSEGYYRFSTLVAQAQAALRWFSRRPEVDARRLGVFGFSMGGWTALNLSGAESAVRAAVAVAPVGGPEMVAPSNGAFIRSHCVPLRVRSPRGLVRDFREAVTRFDPAAAAARTRADLLLIHGSADAVIPYAVSQRIRAAGGSSRCRLVKAAGADHSFLDRRNWLARRAARWLASRLRG